jgi:N-acyl-D-aspartate/D-glutamate deacylase
MIDCLIRGGLVVDGTGAPARRADIAIDDGRIVEVGEVSDTAATTVDADGLAVAPGFIDLHTHYDAQLHWDPLADPSSQHGVTTVIGGNCGFALAPVTGDGSDYLARLMARVEGIPLPALQAGLDWDWRGVGDFLAGFDGKLGVNAGFLAGHSSIRRAAMPGKSADEPATDAEIQTMTALLRDALQSGALGFSTSRSPTHRDGDGTPVPSRGATPEELLALAEATRDYPGASLALIPAGAIDIIGDAEADLMAQMSAVSAHTMNWNTISVDSDRPERHIQQMEVSRRARAIGGRVVALTSPYLLRLRLSFLTGFVFDTLPGWRELLFEKDVPQRIEALRRPDVRAALVSGAERATGPLLEQLARWVPLSIAETFHPQNPGLLHRSIADIASERGGDPFDVLADIVVSDELRTGLQLPARADDAESWALRARLWEDEDIIIGGSDAGAHLDVMCGAALTTALLGDVVRERGLLSLERAVQLVTDIPATLYNLRARGRVAPGYFADLVLFDPATVGFGPTTLRKDLPGGAYRLSADAIGVHRVMVNGVDLLIDGQPTGHLPGTVLRAPYAVPTP